MAKKMFRYILISCMLLLGAYNQLSARSYRESTLSAVSHLKDSEHFSAEHAETPFIHSWTSHRAPMRATLPFSENEEQEENDEDEEVKSSKKQTVSYYTASAVCAALADTISDKKPIPDFSHYHLSALSELYLVFGVFRL